jgi:hypothetical protein
MTEPGSFQSPSWPAIPPEPAPQSVEKLPTDECGHESYPKRVCSVVIWELWRADPGDLQGQERIFRRVGLSDLPAGDIRECLSPRDRQRGPGVRAHGSRRPGHIRVLKQLRTPS